MTDRVGSHPQPTPPATRTESEKNHVGSREGPADRDFAFHLAAALRRHRLLLERDGYSVPEGLSLLEDLAAFRVRTGPDGSVLDRSASAAEGVVVAQRLLTIEQVAAALTRSRSTVQRLIRAGELAAVTVRGALRVRVTDLDAYVAALPAYSTRRSA